MSILFPAIPSKRLSVNVAPASTTFRLDDIQGWDSVNLTSADVGDPAYGVFRDVNSTVIELFEYDPATIASLNIVFVRRGLNFRGGLTTEVAANKLEWVRGSTICELGSNPPQLFQQLKEYIDGIAIGGSPDSSTSTKGIGRVSVAPASAATPIFVGDNDTRVPTASGAQFISATTGMISMYAGTTAPTGFLPCDGAAVSRATFAALFAVISTSYGVGDGATTFNVPDGRGRTFIGAGTGTLVATFASRASNVLTVTGLTNKANNGFQTGQAVTYATSGTVITGLSNNTVYYLVRTGNLTFSLATTLADAQNGTVIALSGDGTGTQTFTITLTARVVGERGGEENHAMSSAELLLHNHTTGTINSGGPESNAITFTTDVSDVNQGANSNLMRSAGGNAAMNNMQPFFAGLWIIKT